MKKTVAIMWCVVGNMAGGFLLLGTLGGLMGLAIAFGELSVSPFYWAPVRFFAAIGGILGLIKGILECTD